MAMVDLRAPLGVRGVRDEQPHREKRSNLRLFDTANTATATAINVAFCDFPYLTLLRKRANTTTISNFYN